uniref:Uncharacterized protein n=1 Tax=Anguilla anguilla TaxID=7936 RepID=A0A0E9PZY7_ANGAN
MKTLLKQHPICRRPEPLNLNLTSINQALTQQ